MSRQNIPGTSIPDLGFRSTGTSANRPFVGSGKNRAVENRAVESHSRLPAGHPLAKPSVDPSANPFGYGIGEVTPSEGIAIEALELELNERYMGKQFGDSDPSMLDEFERVVQERFGALGFVVRVEWVAVEAEGMPGRAYLPSIQFLARTANKETDHELVQREVQAGLAGGGAYSIREDGSKSDDPIRKQI